MLREKTPPKPIVQQKPKKTKKEEKKKELTEKPEASYEIYKILTS